eukprot:gene10732-3352_t
MVLTKKQKKLLANQYASSLKELNNMGFTNKTQNLTALQANSGDLNNAVNWILSNPMDNDESSSEEEEEELIFFKSSSTKSNLEVPEPEFQDEVWYVNKEVKKLQSLDFEHHDNMVLYDGKLIFFGAKNEIVEFDLEKQKCEQIKIEFEGKTGGNYAQLNGKLYFYGGENSKNEFLEYDIKTHKMTSLSSSGLPALHHHVMCGYEGKVYVFGGIKVDGLKSKELFSYDIQADKWNKIEVFGDQLGDLSSPQMIGISKKLIIHGGLDSFNQRKTEIYQIDLLSNVSKKITTKTSVEKYDGKLIKIDEDTLLLFGGFEKFGGFSDEMWSYDMEKQNFFKLVYENSPKFNKAYLVYDEQKNQLLTTQKSNLFYNNLPRKGVFHFYLNPEFSDMNIVVKKDLKIPAHKAVISQSRFFFEKLKTENEIDWTSYDPSISLKVLKYLYGKKIILESDQIIPVIYFARDFEIPHLEIHCVAQLSTLLPDGILTVLSQNEDYIRNVKKQRFLVGDYLKTWCLEYYQKNLEEFDSKKMWDQIQKFDDDLKIEMITLPSLEDNETIIPKDGLRIDQLFNHLKNLSKNKEFCDFNLKCDDLSLASHKIVFCDVPYFSSKLSNSNEVQFNDESTSTVKLFHQLSYDPSIDIEDKLIYIAKFSDKYDLKLNTASFTPVTFSTLGAVGSYGPTSTNGYSGTSLEGLVTLKEGIQLWRVPKTRNYTITAGGACGGTGDRSAPEPGRGFTVSGEFKLCAGTILHIVVGQHGGSGIKTSNSAGGGGGASWVVEEGITPLIVGSGGHGDNWRSWNTDGVNGLGLQKSNPDPLSTKGGNLGSSGRAGGGGSFNEGGQHFSNGQSGGSSFMSGCKGGNQVVSGCLGGFGGGGGAQYEGGGGGGYMGGSICDCNAYNKTFTNRGATSYCSGMNGKDIGLNDLDDGFVIIE